MGLFSGGSRSSRCELFPYPAAWAAALSKVDWGKFAEQLAERRRADHSAHCLIYQRLVTPHDAQVKAWEKWKATPWTWRNHLAHMINRFLQWLERDD